MGLDINVLKPVKVDKIDEEGHYYYQLEDYPELEIFKDFAIDKTNGYYDLEGDMKTLGYDIEDLDYVGAEFFHNVFYKFRDKKHELYEAHKVLDEIWSKTYFDTKKELFDSEEFKKYLEFLPIMKKHGYKPLYKFFATGSQKTYYNLVSARSFAERKCSVVLKNPTVIEKVEKCIPCIEVGYQRKGANKQFYEDDIWGSSCVVTKEKLMEHWEKYFSNNTPESKGGWGSGVEFSLEDDEMKLRFKENIVDKFIEGENFVIYN